MTTEAAVPIKGVAYKGDQMASDEKGERMRPVQVSWALFFFSFFKWQCVFGGARGAGRGILYKIP